jgi:glycosyltransferase involved in cell wall biosynthesis
VSARRKPNVAFVVQRCAADVAGGAERLCLQTASSLRDVWNVEILTTCARDSRTWRDDFAPGETSIVGVPARRFRVPAPRDPAAFDRASERVARGDASESEQIAWMRLQGPCAPDLATHLERAGSGYDRVVFFSYLYATTYFGLPAVAERATLVPLAHDEWMLGLPLFDATFALPARIAYVSEEERALVERRFPATAEKPHALIGVGIEAAPRTPPPAFRRAHGIRGQLLVYVGRVEEAKGMSALLSHFAALQATHDGAHTLLLAGPIGMALPQRADVIALGQVDETTKWDALAAADIACVPSSYESLSIAALEAWAVGTPVLANGASPVLIGQCRRSNGGLWYANESEFVELVRTGLYGHAERLGENGARFVAATYTWAASRAAFAEALGLTEATTA